MRMIIITNCHDWIKFFMALLIGENIRTVFAASSMLQSRVLCLELAFDGLLLTCACVCVCVCVCVCRFVFGFEFDPDMLREGSLYGFSESA